jgi:hypothetical protein
MSLFPMRGEVGMRVNIEIIFENDYIFLINRNAGYRRWISVAPVGKILPLRQILPDTVIELLGGMV